MKRYKMMYVEEIIEHEDGKWVKAEVAQALYDVLKDIVLKSPVHGPLNCYCDEIIKAIQVIDLIDGNGEE